MRRKDLGNVIVKKAIMLAMAFMMGITTLGSNVITARADEAVATEVPATQVVVDVNVIDKAVEDTATYANAVNEYMNIEGVEQEINMEDAEAAAKTADEAMDTVVVADTLVKAMEAEIATAEAAEEAADTNMSDAFDNIDDVDVNVADKAIEDAEKVLNSASFNEAAADGVVADLEKAKVVAEEELKKTTDKVNEAQANLTAAEEALKKAEEDAKTYDVEKANKAVEDAKKAMDEAVVAASLAVDRVDIVNGLLDEATALLEDYKITDEHASLTAPFEQLAEANVDIEPIKNAYNASADAQHALDAAKDYFVCLNGQMTNVGAGALGELYNLASNTNVLLTPKVKEMGIENYKPLVETFVTLDKATTADEKIACMISIADQVGVDASNEEMFKLFAAAYNYDGEELTVEEAVKRYKANPQDADVLIPAYQSAYVKLWVEAVRTKVVFVNEAYKLADSSVNEILKNKGTDNWDASVAAQQQILATVASCLIYSQDDLEVSKAVVKAFSDSVKYDLAVKASAAKANAVVAAATLNSLQFTVAAPEKVKAAREAYNEAVEAYNEAVEFIGADSAAVIKKIDDEIAKVGRAKAAFNQPTTPVGPVVTPVTPTTPVTPVATVQTGVVAADATQTANRTVRRQAAAAVVADDNNDNVEIAEEATPLATEEPEAEEVVEDEEIVEIGDEDIPEAAETKKLSWWWLLILALIAALGVVARFITKKKATKKVK